MMSGHLRKSDCSSLAMLIVPDAARSIFEGAGSLAASR
jgi:hypothetical protein